ncbi:MAG: hypothetical protein KJ795_10515 [Gammaproteobacteria bacterium]|nr:hypothetical protein [Gammaproteobacteria bacterium]MBU1775224.1 hypothetical protein [Gammaproteobacteria bacterium]MBU1969207.1 hypothetical protein [Gammaproteobacteria bacterium]
MDNPENQFIEIAPDSPTQQSIVPQPRNGKPTVATIEYELLSSKPYAFTLAELKFATHVKHKQIPAAELKTHGARMREEFFAKPYACMRASPLTKQYGWGAHYDEKGGIAIYPVEGREYQRFVKDKSIKKYFAVRSKKA